uniref:SH3 domain-containing protein n=1 Tax=uncultured Clostridium sp. TaxID=59620 RepID=UPI00260735D5
MKKNKILAIIISGVMIVTVSGAIGQTRKDSKENIILKKVNNTLLINNNTNYSVNACVVNGNGRLVLTNKNGEIASYLSVGEMLKIQSVEGNKSLVTVEETGAKGYINNSNKIDINKGDINNITRMNKDGYIINVSNVVNLRKGPSMNYTVLEALSNSTHVKITGKTDQWYKVDVNGEKGYIFEEYVGEKNISQSNHSLKDIYTVSKVNSVALPHSNNLSDIHITPNIKSIASDGSKIVSSASKAKGDVHIIPVNKAVESTTDSSDNTSGHKIKPIVSDGSKIVSSASKAKGDAHTMPVNKVGKSTTDSSDNTSGHKIKPIVSGGSKTISSNSKTKGDVHTMPVNKVGKSTTDSSDN